MNVHKVVDDGPPGEQARVLEHIAEASREPSSAVTVNVPVVGVSTPDTMFSNVLFHIPRADDGDKGLAS